MTPEPSETPETPEGAPEAVDRAAAESFGRYLARERELRGMSVAQVAEETRIGAANLRALEADDLDRLPERVFVVGYIRAYAKTIGLNPDDAVLRFDEHCLRREPPEEQGVRRKRSRLGVAIAVGALVLLALGAGGWVLFLR